MYTSNNSKSPFASLGAISAAKDTANKLKPGNIQNVDNTLKPFRRKISKMQTTLRNKGVCIIYVVRYCFRKRPLTYLL